MTCIKTLNNAEKAIQHYYHEKYCQHENRKSILEFYLNTPKDAPDLVESSYKFQRGCWNASEYVVSTVTCPDPYGQHIRNVWGDVCHLIINYPVSKKEIDYNLGFALRETGILGGGIYLTGQLCSVMWLLLRHTVAAVAKFANQWYDDIYLMKKITEDYQKPLVWDEFRQAQRDNSDYGTSWPNATHQCFEDVGRIVQAGCDTIVTSVSILCRIIVEIINIFLILISSVVILLASKIHASLPWLSEQKNLVVDAIACKLFLSEPASKQA